MIQHCFEQNCKGLHYIQTCLKIKRVKLVRDQNMYMHACSLLELPELMGSQYLHSVLIYPTGQLLLFYIIYITAITSAKQRLIKTPEKKA